MFIRKVFLFLVLTLSLSFADDSITIGIAPHSSPRIILETHNDLKVFLENYFKRPVQIVTAKNFSEFAKRTNDGLLYDLVLTSPNLAFLANKYGKYEPILTYTKGLSTIIIGKNKDILKDKTKKIHAIGLDPVSFVTLNAEDWLETNDFIENDNIFYSYSSASDSAAAILLNGEADLAIMSLPNYLKLNDNTKEQVKILYQSLPQPSRIYLAKNKNKITTKIWEDALKKFANSAEGKKHLETTQLEGFKQTTQNELNKLKNIGNKTLKKLDNK